MISLQKRVPLVIPHFSQGIFDARNAFNSTCKFKNIAVVKIKKKLFQDRKEEYKPKNVSIRC